jgi:para-nitrobenzyl esterase
VIVISVQYRLGTLGWFRHPALAETAANDLDRSGNFGTLDLIAALEWVRRNAAAFGGDPNRVTIFGESAGGANVYSLLMSPRAKGLFHRAIVQSGGIESYDRETAATSPAAPWGANEVALRTLIRAGRATDRNDAALQHERMTDVELSTFLRSLSVQDLLLIHSEATLGGMYFATDLIRDGKVLPQEEFEDGLRAGKYNRVPVILGSNRDEARLFQFLDPKNVRVWFWLFPRLRDRDHYLTITEYHSQMWKAAGVDQPATSMHANQGDTVFAYRFDWDEEPAILGANFADMLGAAHFLEVPFVFGHFELGRLGRITFSDENLPGRQEVSEAMMSYWAEFAYTGNPGRGRAGTLPQWRAWDGSTPEADKFIVLDTQTDGGIRMENTSIREADLLAAIKSDPRLPDLRDKCHLYYKLGEFREVMPPAEYDAFCGPEFPREVWESD